MPEKDDSRFVLKSECAESMNQIRLALFGPDLRGGIVKDIADIKTDLHIIRNNLKGRLSGKDKAAIIAALIAATAAIIVALLK